MNEHSALSLQDFLENVPVLEPRMVHITFDQRGSRFFVVPPPVALYCAIAACQGVRFFDCKNTYFDVPHAKVGERVDGFLQYICRNCQRSIKTYALRLTCIEAESNTVRASKIGEIPRFGEPRPNAVKGVLGDEIEFFDRGYRAETDGLGIGAFAYYRRFVDLHKNKIIEELRKVAYAQSQHADVLAALDRAAARREFLAAVEEIKDAIPDSIRINGANPLTLLYDALSAGMHSDDDVECLGLAQDIRTVLTALAERTAELLKDDAALKDAVTRLNQRKSAKRQGGGSEPPT